MQSYVAAEGRDPSRRDLTRRATLSLVLCCSFIAVSLSQATAQTWPYGYALPNLGAMAYDLILTRDWRQPGLRISGFTSSQGGAVRWINCAQRQDQPVRVCRLMVNGKTSGEFPLPPNVDLRRWMSSWLRLGLPNILPFDGGPAGTMETSGEWRWGQWTARGTFRYWR